MRKKKVLKYHCFIAHTAIGLEIAIDLHNRLTSKGLRVFLDLRNICPGDFWDSELKAAQENSLSTIIIISKDTKESYYQQEEIVTAIKLNKRYQQKIIPIYLSKSIEDAEIPYGLQRINGLFLNNENKITEIVTDIINVIENHSLHYNVIDFPNYQLIEDNNDKSDDSNEVFSNSLRFKEPSLNKQNPVFNKIFSDLNKIRISAKKNKIEASIIFFDIDGMTNINKIYGKAIGDLVIKTIEDISITSVNKNFIIYKVGVDEFIAYGFDSDFEDAWIIAQRLCDNISNYHWHEIAQSLRVTASFGVANMGKPEKCYSESFMIKNG